MKTVALRAIAALVLLAAFGCRRKTAPLVPEGKDLTRPAAEWLAMEPVRLLRDYVRIDTRVENGEREGALFLQRLLDCEGISSELVCPQPGRCNLLARLPGKRRDGALLLLNHIDVAPVYAPFWKEAPFEGTIKRGYLYGRGAFDMKALGLAQLLAMRSLKRRGVVPETDILFLAEADEETGQRLGSAWLLERRPEWFRGVANVLNEGGTNEIILRAVRFWGVETLEAGYGDAELEMSERTPFEKLSGRWPRLEGQPVTPHPHVVEGFDMLANHLGHPFTDPLRHLERARRDPKELAILPDRYGAFLEPRIKFFGPYPFPPESKDRFRGVAAIFTPPGIDPGPFLRKVIEDARRGGLEVVESFSSGPTSASPWREADGRLTPFLGLLERVTQARWPGVPFGPIPTFAGTTTSIYFRQRGIPAYGWSPLPVNITDSARRHGNDERIYLRDYINGVDLYREVIEEFAVRSGVELSPPSGKD